MDKLAEIMATNGGNWSTESAPFAIPEFERMAGIRQQGGRFRDALARPEHLSKPN